MRILAIRPVVFRRDGNKVTFVLCKGGPYCSVEKRWREWWKQRPGNRLSYESWPKRMEAWANVGIRRYKEVCGFKTHPEIRSVGLVG